MKAIFAHKQTFSRKGNSKNRSVADICAEAARLEGSTPHVADPKRPSLMYDNVELSEIPAIIEARVKEQNASLRQQRKEHPEKAGDLRSIRRDTHVLVGYVFSYPVSNADLITDDQMWEHSRWEDDALNFAIADAERNGLEVLSAVAHTDENHPHFHVLAIPMFSEQNPRLNAKLCHEGFVAQSAHTAKKLSGSPSRSYRQAMRSWQDRYHTEVGQRHGQARMGPGRRRMSREAYKTEKELLAKMRKSAETEDQIDEKRDMLLFDQEQAKLEVERRQVETTEHRAQIAAEQREAEENNKQDRQLLLDALRSQRHALIAQEHNAKIAELNWKDKLAELSKEKAAFEQKLSSARIKAAKEAALCAVEVIAAVLTGDVRIGKDGRVVVKDKDLRERGNKIGGSSTFRDTVHTMEQIWETLKSLLSPVDIHLQRKKVQRNVQRLRDDPPSGPTR